MATTKEHASSKYMTVKEVGQELRLSRWTVYRLIENGVLDHKRFGRNIRVFRESFERFVENA